MTDVEIHVPCDTEGCEQPADVSIYATVAPDPDYADPEAPPAREIERVLHYCSDCTSRILHSIAGLTEDPP